MRFMLKVSRIPISQTAVLLIGIFLTASQFGGGGSPQPIVLRRVKPITTCHVATDCSALCASSK